MPILAAETGHKAGSGLHSGQFGLAEVPREGTILLETHLSQFCPAIFEGCNVSATVAEFTVSEKIMLAAYGLVVFAAWMGQRRLLYVPNPSRVAPASLGLTGVVETELATPDGERLVTWRAAARAGQPTLLYFHGNAGNLASRANRARRYTEAGFGLLMLSYRGYGGSTGWPSEANNIADARLAYDLLRSQGLGARDIVLYGESLGSGIAVQLAVEKPVGAVVLDAPYTSIVDVAAGAYPFLPVRPLLADRYESSRLIRQVKAPLLVLHGIKDRVIPVAMGRALYAVANEPKRLEIFPEGRHTDLDDHGAVDVVLGWLAEVLRGR